MRAFLVAKVNPSYPSEAEKQHVDGTVLLRISIDKNGKVSKVEPVSGHPLLVPAAMDAVKQWKYRPYVLKQKPIEVETTVLIKFVIAFIRAEQESGKLSASRLAQFHLA